MHRVFIPSNAIQGDHVTIRDPRTLRHLRQVLRMRIGERLECFDGTGERLTGRIARQTPGEIVLDVTARRREPEASRGLTLAQALIRPQHLEWIIQKASELGVSCVVPVVTARTVIRLPSGQAGGKLVRWRRIAQEAARQCGRASVARVEPPISLEAFAQTLRQYDAALIPTLAVEAPPLREALDGVSRARSVCILIGPEGDFTTAEVALAARHGARPVSLGRLTLRAETAALATLVILQHAAGRL